MKKKKVLLGFTLAIFAMTALASCNGKTKKSTETSKVTESSRNEESQESSKSSEESKNTSNIETNSSVESSTNVSESNVESTNVSESNAESINASESNAESTNVSESNAESTNVSESNVESTNVSESNVESTIDEPTVIENPTSSDEVQKYTVTFIVNNDVYQTQEIEENKMASKPKTNPYVSGKNFLYWSYMGQEFNFSTNITDSITLVAEFEDIDLENTYTFGFGDGLTPWYTVAGLDAAPAENTILSSAVTIDAFSFPANGKSRVNAKGAGFNTQKGDITIVMKTKGTIYVEGRWGSTKNTGNVYLKKGSTEVYKSSTYQADTNVAIDFSKEVEAGTYILGATEAINITRLYFVRDYKTATVTYSTQFGSVNPKTYEVGDKLGQLPEINEDGYIFNGWKLPNGDFATADTVVEDDLVLTADFEVYNANNFVTVNFEAGNMSLNPVELKKGTEYTAPELALDGYKFNGWYTDSEYKYLFVDGTKIEADITLHAQFIKKHTVTYMYDDNTVISTEVVLDNESVVNVPAPKTIYGMMFDGWKVNNQLDFDLESNVTSDLVLVAHYSEVAVTDKIVIMSSSAYQEGLFAEFMAFEGAESYNAYVKLSSGSYTKVDSQLIRKYKTEDGKNNYYRVDVVGLKAGSYTLKVAPVVNGTEIVASATEIQSMNVIAHDRSGFAFVNGSSSGAYNDDGTLRQNAQVLYITETTKNTVSMDVVTNNKGATTNGVGLQNILNLYKKGYDTRPLDVRFIGQITDLQILDDGDIVISGSGASKRVSCGITFEGIGKDATCDGWGLRIKNATNVEVRNLGFMNCNSGEGDNIGLQQNNDHVWVHNCDLFYGDAGSDADQAKGDGALDTKTSTYVTHSFNHFWDSGKCNLQGMKSESTSNYITYHHNWYDHSDSRHPRIRTCTVHIYNNYFDGNSKYGVGVTTGASAFVENNYFRSTSTMRPMLSSLQGTDIQGGGEFSGETGGIIKSFGNVFDGNVRYITYQQSNIEFDAYEASSRNEVVPANVITKSGGTTYNNFDTSSSMYTYTVQTAEEAKNTVIQYAGRVQGGDFKWTFNNETEDSNYAVITALKQALTNYKTNLVSVQGIEGN